MTDADYMDILLNQCPSVVEALVECFKWTGNGSKMLRMGARLVGSLDGEQLTGMWGKQNYDARMYLCEHCAQDLVPVLMSIAGQHTGGDHYLNALNRRLAK